MKRASDIAIRSARRSGTFKEPELIRRHRPDFLLVIFMVFLMMLGLVVLYSINPALEQRYENNFILKQVVFLFLGLGAFLAASRFPLRLLEKIAPMMLVAGVGMSLLLLLLSFLPGQPLVTCVGDVCRWFDLGVVSFQPAEFLKFALIMYMAVFLSARMREGKLNERHESLIPIAVIIAVISFIIIVLQRDMGTGAVLLAIAAAMLFIAGIQMKYFMTALGVMLAAGVLMIVSSSHRIERVMTFIGHNAATDASTYHIEQALIAIGSGGFFGLGLAQGVQAFGYLPEAANDSIFAVLAEVFGFVGTLAILLVFAGLVYRLIVITDISGRPEFRLMMIGITTWIGSHIIVNIGAMIGVIPLTGITLPFLSFGGTSLIFIMAAMGVAFQISRYTSHKSAISQERARDENHYRGRRFGGSRDTRTRRYQRA